MRGLNWKKLILLLAVLLTCRVALAQDNLKAQKYFGLTKGVNKALNPMMIDDRELASAQNVYFDEGSILTRPGMATVLNSVAVTGDVVGFHDFALPDGNRYFMCASDDNYLYKMDGLDGTWDTINTSFTCDNVTFTTFVLTNGDTVAIAMDDGATPVYWDGSSATTTELPTAEANAIQIVHRNRLWAAGNDDFPNRLSYTDVLEADDFTSGGTIQIDFNDGDEITGLAELKYSGTTINNYLVIFKKRSIYVLDASDPTDTNWVVSKLNSNVGCISNKSIQNIDNMILFLAYDGVYKLEGTSVSQISDRIDTDINAINPARLDDSVSVVFKDYDHYLLGVSDGSATQNNVILAYDYLLDAWLGDWTGLVPGQMTTVTDPTTLEQFIYSSDYNSTVFRMYTGTNDNSAAIDATFDTKRFTFDLAWMKHIRYEYVYAEGSGAWELDDYYRLDSGSTWTSGTLDLTPASNLWGTMVWGTDVWGSEDDVKLRREIDKECWGIQFRFGNDDLDEYFKFYGFIVYLQGIRRSEYYGDQ